MTAPGPATLGSVTDGTPQRAGPAMKAVRFHEVGGPEVLRYEDVDLPHPRRG